MNGQVLSAEALALHGAAAKKTPFGTGRRHGELEKELLNEVIDSDVLFFYTGQKVRQFEREFGQLYGMKHVLACSAERRRYISLLQA
jgi:dTDP-4-amino-4,6-dideoxygalactose transaminase